eukprot:766725-Hanusia_phi.AAC.4
MRKYRKELVGASHKWQPVSEFLSLSLSERIVLRAANIRYRSRRSRSPLPISLAASLRLPESLGVSISLRSVSDLLYGRELPSRLFDMS